MLSAQGLTLTFNPGTPIETRALRGLSLEIPSGQFVSVIGSNGAGKSTFLNSISGDQLVDSGRITIDGVDIRGVTLQSLRRQIGIVLEETTLFGGTIRENIAYGRPEASDAAIEAAARAAAFRAQQREHRALGHLGRPPRYYRMHC